MLFGSNWPEASLNMVMRNIQDVIISQSYQDFQTLIQNTSITHTLLQPLLEIKYPQETLEESHDY